MISGMNSWKTMNSGHLVYQEVSWQKTHIWIHIWIHKNHEWNHEFIYEFMKKTYDLGCTKKCPVEEFLYMNSYSLMWIHIWSHVWKHFLWFHIWTHIWIHVCESAHTDVNPHNRCESSHLFSVMNSYYEFIIMKSTPWIQIEYNEFLYLISYIYEFIYEFRIHTFEFISMNSYTHEFIYSFHIWIQMYMNSCNHFIYEFI